MKFSASQLLALCVIQTSMWSSSAFTASSIKTRATATATELAVSNTRYTDTNTNNRMSSNNNYGGSSMQSSNRNDRDSYRSVMDTMKPVIIQGASLRTWSFSDTSIETVQVYLKTEGRPLNANVELWHGPDNTPQKMSVYCEDGNTRPFNTLIMTPRGHNAICVRNTGHLEFPFIAGVESTTGQGTILAATDNRYRMVVQGGAIRTFPFAPNVESVQVLLETDGRPLSARLELLQGPNNKKQTIELYTEDGLERPFFMVLECPGAGNIIRLINTATIEYPLTARVEPFTVKPGTSAAPLVSPGTGRAGDDFFFSVPN